MVPERHFAGSPPWIGAWLFTLFLVYPIPNTIALRNLLLGVGIVVLAWGARPLREGLRATYGELAWARGAGWMLAALTTWILFQSTFLSPFSATALGELRGQWLMPLLVVIAGILAATRSTHALTALALALTAHIGYLFFYQAWQWHVTGQWPSGSSGLTPFAERDYHSLLNGLLLALLLGDRLCNWINGHRTLRLPTAVIWWALAASLVADLLLRTRNGTLVTVLLLVTVVLLLLALRVARWNWMGPLAAILVVLVAIGALSLRGDARWSGLVESVAIGWQSDSQYWRDASVGAPLTSSGVPLEESAYMRAAWASQAVKAIAEHPLGLGFGHEAFGRAIEMEYGQKGMVSSHSGWLDFALANGLPGLILWLALSYRLMRLGWRHFRETGDGHGLMLTFTVLGYLVRCLVDGHLNGWRLAMYALLVGALIGAMSGRRVPA